MVKLHQTPHTACSVEYFEYFFFFMYFIVTLSPTRQEQLVQLVQLPPPKLIPTKQSRWEKKYFYFSVYCSFKTTVWLQFSLCHRFNVFTRPRCSNTKESCYQLAQWVPLLKGWVMTPHIDSLFQRFSHKLLQPGLSPQALTEQNRMACSATICPHSKNR